MMKLSAVICCFNQAHYLARQLHAFSKQNYSNLEFILVDDGSDDNTFNLMQDFSESVDAHIILIRNQNNMGIHDSVSIATMRASGDYIYFAGADDEIQPGMFDEMMGALQIVGKSAGLLFCDPIWERGGVKVINRINTPGGYKSPNELMNLYRTGVIKHIAGHTLIWNRKLFVQYGMCKKELYKVTDFFPTWVLGFKAGAIFVPKPLALGLIHNEQWSNSRNSDKNKINDAFERLFYEIEKLDDPRIGELIYSSNVLTRFPEIAPVLISNHELRKKFRFSIRLAIYIKYLVIKIKRLIA